jgi:TPR repeat protein
MRTLHLFFMFLSVVLSGCAHYPNSPRSTDLRLGYGQDWISTSEKYLPLAEAGDPEFQNLIGFMLYFGEGISMNRLEAHFWFHKAADHGHRAAQRNLAIMHWLGIDVSQDLEEAKFYAQLAGMNDLDEIVDNLPSKTGRGAHNFHQDNSIATRATERGESTYVSFCAGCHGLNGIAAYVGSPSFALGERLEKSDAVLLDSIRNGRGVMPDWGNKFTRQRLRDVLAFLRKLEQRYQNGIAQTLRDSPERYFLFSVMENDHSAHRMPF